MKKHSKRETRYVSQLVVHAPSASSLIDMMRYDSCFPATEDESRKIWKLIGHEQCGNDAKPEDHIVRLHRVARTELPATADRWKSFNCTVLDERTLDEDPITFEEALKRLKADVARWPR